MKAADLQIGFYATDNNGETFRVDAVDIMILHHYDNKNAGKVQPANSAPILPVRISWTHLVNLDFEDDGEGFWTQRSVSNKFRFTYNFDMGWFQVHFGDITMLLNHVQYIHQIQSIIFALTNKKL